MKSLTIISALLLSLLPATEQSPTPEPQGEVTAAGSETSTGQPSFIPSEKIPAGTAVAFPVDI